MAKPDFEVYLDEENNDIEPVKINTSDNSIKPSRLEKISTIEKVERPERPERVERVEGEVVIEDKKEKKRDTSEGWDQGNGRRADQLVIYESNIPPHIKNKITPHKGTHFKFINKNDENEFIRMIQGRDNFTAIYSPHKKKDITITQSDGTLIGNIHLLHVNGPDIHNPSKYYIKLYFFNFNNINELKKIKVRIQDFFKKIEQLTDKFKLPVKKHYKINSTQKHRKMNKRKDTLKHRRIYKRGSTQGYRRMSKRIDTLKHRDNKNSRNKRMDWNRTKRKLNEMKDRLVKRSRRHNSYRD